MLHSGLNKILGGFFSPFTKEVYSSLGATRTDFIYSFEVQFSYGTEKTPLYTICTVMISSLLSHFKLSYLIYPMDLGYRNLKRN